MSYALALSPGGHLFVEPDDQAEPKLSPATVARLTEAFGASPARGVEALASEFLHEPMPPTFVFWRGVAQRLFTAPAMSDSEVADVFGIELEPQSAASAHAVEVPISPPPTPAPSSTPAPRRRAQRKQKFTHRVSATARARIAAAARLRWAKLKRQKHDSIRTL